MSGASVSSMGSSAAESSVFNPKGELAPGDDEGFEEPHSIQQGCFGVLYTVCKEQYLTSIKFTLFRLLLDFLQLWLLVVNPAYGFDIAAGSTAWKAVSFIQLNWILSERGYMFFLVVLYIFIALLAVNVGLSVWVAHQFYNNSFDHVWPIVFLRWFGLIFYQVLDVATLTLLLGTLDCQYFGVPEEVRFQNQLFPDVYCWSMPHLVHVAVSVVSILVFLVMAGAMVVSQMDLNPLTRHYMGIMHTWTEGYSFLIKTFATIASVMIGDIKWLSIIYLGCFLVLMYLQTKWVPFTFNASNYMRSGTYGAVLYCSILLVALAYGSPSDPLQKEKFSRSITIAVWAGMAPAALLSALACHLRLRHLCASVGEKFRTAEPDTISKYIYKFTDAREVEVALRVCREWVDEDTPEPDSVKLGESILKAGMTKMPTDPRMVILYSSFLIDVQGSYQSGFTQLQAAKKQSPGILERFAIFTREQEHAQKVSGANGGAGAAVDLVSYVEFQRSHRLVTRAHKEALMAMRSFWGLLMRSNVNFVKLTQALNRIEVTVRAAERAYRTVLNRHSSNARLVRLYGRFLESVKFDPWAASKWFTEAERLEEKDEHAKEAMQLGGVSMGGAGIVEGVPAIFINSQGIIQVASPEAAALLGYQKTELKGKDVGVIMPPPFGDRHNAYLRNYIQTGVSSGILDRQNDFVALSKSRDVVPIRLRVTKVSGLSEDSVFMGTLEALPKPPGVARAWLLGGGSGGGVGVVGVSITLIAADDRFYDWLGYEQADLVGQPVGDLLADEEAVTSAARHLWSLTSSAAPISRNQRKRRASSTSTGISAGGDMAGGGTNAHAEGRSVGGAQLAPAATLPGLEWRHKYSGLVPFQTTLTTGAFGSVRYMVVTLHADWHLSVPRPGGLGLPSAISELMLVSDHKGRLLHVTAALAQALGRTMESIRAGGMEMLLPEPYSSLHGPWMQALAAAPGQALPGGLDRDTTPPPHSCRTGVAVSLCAYDEAEGPVTLPFRLRLQQRLMQKGASRVHVVSLEKLAREQVLSERRLRLTVDISGTITSVDAAPTQLFGLDPRVVVGKALGELVDLFRLDDTLREINTALVATSRDDSGIRSFTVAKNVVEDDDVLAGVAGVFGAASGRQTTKQLLELARRSSEAEGVSWRVGVKLPPDANSAAELEHLARSLGPNEVAVASKLIGGKVVPAVMRVRLVRRDNTAPSNSVLTPVSPGQHAAKPPTAASPHAQFAAPPKWSITWNNDVSHQDSPVGRRPQQQPSPYVAMPAPPAMPLPPAPPPLPPVPVLSDGPTSPTGRTSADVEADATLLLREVDGGGLEEVLATSLARLPTPGSLILAEDLHRPSSLRLAAPPDLRRTATTSNASARTLASPNAAYSAAPLAPRTVSTRDLHHLAAEGISMRGDDAAGLHAAGDVSPEPQHATSLAPSLYLEVELWRADLLSGVVEVDERGRVLRIDPTDSLGQTGLVLGASKADLMTGCSINSLLPLPVGGTSALFTTGEGGGGLGVLRGALKSRRKADKAAASPPTTLVGCHMGDGCAFSVCVQAVRRAGPYGSLYLIIRPHEPAPVQEGFMRWLADEGDVSGLARRTQLGYRDTSQGYRDTALGFSTDGAAAGAGAAAAAKVLAAAFGSGSQPPSEALARASSLKFANAREPKDEAAGLSNSLMPAAAPPPPPPQLQLQLSSGLDSLRIAPMRGAAGGPAGTASGPSRSRFATNSGAGAAEGDFAQLPQRTLTNGSGGEDSAYDQALPLTVTAAMELSATAAANPLSGAVQKLLAAGGPMRSPSASMAQLPTDSAGVAGVGQGTKPTDSLSLPGQPNLTAQQSTDAIPSPRMGAALLGDEPVGGFQVSSLLVGDLVRTQSSSSLQPGAPKVKKDAKLLAVQSWVHSGGKQHLGSEIVQAGMVVTMHGAAAESAGGSGGDDKNTDGKDMSSGNSGRSSEEGDRLSSVDAAQQDHAHDDGAGRAAVINGLLGGGSGQAATVEQSAGKSGGDRDSGGVGTVEDEAGAHVTNYGAGKRFKKIYKMLMGPQAQRASKMLLLQALLVIGILLVGHTVTFSLMVSHLQLQEREVTELDSLGLAATRVHEIALRTRTLEELFKGKMATANGTEPLPLIYGVPVFGDPYKEAVASVLESMHEAIMHLKELHHGTYLGFSSARQIPEEHGLRDIWDLPLLNITKFFDSNDENGEIMAAANLGPGIKAYNLTSSTIMMGLWDAGNLFVAQALEVAQNAIPLVERGVDFSNWSPYRFVQENGLSVLWPAYLKSLDAMIQITVANGQEVYTIQLIMLCMESGVVFLVACTFMWFAAQKFVGTRYSLYSVFVHVPMGLTRGLANMSIQLEPGEEEDDDPTLAQGAEEGGGGGNDEQPAPTTDKAEGAAAAIRSLRIDSSAFQAGDAKKGGEGAPALSALSRRLSGIIEAAKKQQAAAGGADAPAGAAAATAGGAVSAGGVGGGGGTAAAAGGVLGILSLWRGRVNKVSPSGSSSRKRRLVPSRRIAAMLVLPFLLWGSIVVAVNLAGFTKLADNDGPIASLGVMHTVVVHMHRLLYRALDFAAAFGTSIAPTLQPALQSELQDTILEYSVLLFGHEALSWSQANYANHTDEIEHLGLAPKGIIYSGGKVTDILYRSHGCLSVLPEDCQPADSPYYEVTRNGLDVLVKAQFMSVESLLNQNTANASSGLNSTEFRFMWSTFETDIEGAVDQLMEMYLGHVQMAYHSVLTEQIILLVIAWVWGLAFLALQLRPFLRRSHLEMRRIAELLSQLPPEVDVETMVARVVLGGEVLVRAPIGTTRNQPSLASMKSGRF